MVPGYTCIVTIKSQKDTDGSGGVVLCDSTIVGGTTRRMREKKKDSGGGGGKDVVAKTAEGAIKWVERDLEKWCRSYNFDKEEEEDERTKTTTTTKGRTKIDGNEVVERVLEEEFKPQPEELEASLKDAKKGGKAGAKRQ